MSKTKNAIKNTTFSAIGNIIAILIGLVSQKIFLKILGVKYLGLNGLFTNIISMLGIAELGVGTAIIYKLYEPIAKNNKEEIKSLMLFYKKAYRIIGFVVLAIGLILIPFLQYIINDSDNLPVNIYVVYLFFLLDSAFSYFLSYKRSLLYAYQKKLYSSSHTYNLFSPNEFFQLLLLYLTKNYYVYLGIKLLFRIVENVLIILSVNKMYPYIKEKNINKLDKKTESDIFTKIKALFYHQIGSFIVLGTDNIIISKYLGLVEVGLYSNYNTIINALNKVFGEGISAITPSVGNLLVENNKEKNYEIYKKINFVTYWLATFSSIAFFLIVQPFIKLWLGKKYLLSLVTVCILSINYHQSIMRSSPGSFKNAAGIFYEDRYVPLFESVINIVASIILVKIMGLPGVFIGTFISSLTLWLYSYPRFVYKKLFDVSFKDYIISITKKFSLFLLILFICIPIVNLFNNNLLFQLIIACLLGITIPNFVLWIVYHKTDEYRYFLEIIKKIKNKFLKLKKV